MYDSKLINKILKRAQKSSITQAAREFSAQSGLIFGIQYKQIQTSSTELPGNILAAYDLKSGLFNFCFTYECNKNNKALYLLYLHDFYRQNGFAGLQKDQLNKNELNSDQLLKIYGFFASRKIDSKQLESNLIKDAGTMHLMGDLSKSDSFCRLMMVKFFMRAKQVKEPEQLFYLEKSGINQTATSSNNI